MYGGSKQTGKVNFPLNALKQNYNLFQVELCTFDRFITYNEDGFSGQRFHKLFFNISMIQQCGSS